VVVGGLSAQIVDITAESLRKLPVVVGLVVVLSFVLLALVFLQIALGGLVAGSRAGFTFNTWPLMDGRLVPDMAMLFAVSPWIENFVDNVALVQFNHRIVAYALVAFALWHAVAAWRAAPRIASLVAKTSMKERP